MADTVQRLLERSVEELEDLQVRGIFNREEIRRIVKARTDFEYRLQARAPDKLDYLRYVKYEYNLDLLRQKRRQRIAAAEAADASTAGPDGKTKRKNNNKKKGKGNGSAMSDFAGERRIHFIFSRAVKKFQGDLPLWNQYIEYAMRGKSHGRLAKIFPEALRLHPKCADLWIKAAVWEYRRNQNIATARTYMQRAIRLNAAAGTLWIEYFRLELDYVRRVRARRSVLGLSAGGNEKVAAKKDADIDVEGADDSENEADEAGDYMAHSATAGFLQGAVPFIVYTNACKSNPEADVDFHIQFLSACGRDFPWLTERILVSCKHRFGDSNVVFWDTYARLPETLLDDSLSDLNVYRKDGGLEIPSEDARGTAGRRGGHEGMMSTDEAASQEAETRFRQALAAVPTSPMWTKYLAWLAEGVENNKDEDNAAAAMVRRHALKQGYEDAHKLGCLEPALYRQWIRLLIMFFPRDGRDGYGSADRKRRKVAKAAMKRAGDAETLTYTPQVVARAATEAYPKSVVAWKVRLNLARHLLATRGEGGTDEESVGQQGKVSGGKRKNQNQNDTGDDDEEEEEERAPSVAALLHLLEEACVSVDPASEDAWEIETMRVEVVHTTKGVGSKLYKQIKDALLRMRRRKYAAEGTTSFLEKLSEVLDANDRAAEKLFQRVMDFVIDSGRAFSARVPVPMFRLAIGREMERLRAAEQEGAGANALLGKIKARVRSLFRKYADAHPKRLSAWLDCARFEIAHGHDAKILVDLNWRATAALGNGSNWGSEFAKVRITA